MSYDEPDDNTKARVVLGQPRLSFRGLQMLAGLLGVGESDSLTREQWDALRNLKRPETVSLSGPSATSGLEDIRSHDYSKAVMTHRRVPSTDVDRLAIGKAEEKRRRKAERKQREHAPTKN